jgi:hypothetical protein
LVEHPSAVHSRIRLVLSRFARLAELLQIVAGTSKAAETCAGAAEPENDDRSAS